MGTVALSGDDTIKINGRSLTDLAEGEVAKLAFSGDLVTLKTGKNGNSLYGFSNTGRQCELTLRVMRGSADDKFLLSILSQLKNNFSGFVLIQGQVIKVIGDGQGNITNDTYVLSGGVITKEVEAESNADGAPEQAVAIYHLKFTNGPRIIS